MQITFLSNLIATQGAPSKLPPSVKTAVSDERADFAAMFRRVEAEQNITTTPMMNDAPDEMAEDGATDADMDEATSQDRDGKPTGETATEFDNDIRRALNAPEAFDGRTDDDTPTTGPKASVQHDQTSVDSDLPVTLAITPGQSKPAHQTVAASFINGVAQPIQKSFMTTDVPASGRTKPTSPDGPHVDNRPSGDAKNQLNGVQDTELFRGGRPVAKSELYAADMVQNGGTARVNISEGKHDGTTTSTPNEISAAQQVQKAKANSQTGPVRIETRQPVTAIIGPNANFDQSQSTTTASTIPQSDTQHLRQTIEQPAHAPAGPAPDHDPLPQTRQTHADRTTNVGGEQAENWQSRRHGADSAMEQTLAPNRHDRISADPTKPVAANPDAKPVQNLDPTDYNSRAKRSGAIAPTETRRFDINASDANPAQSAQKQPTFANAAMQTRPDAQPVWAQGSESQPLFQPDMIEEFTWDVRPQSGSTSTQAHLLPSRPEMPAHVAQQLAQALHRTPDRPLEIALNPAELGRVRMMLTATETGIVVNVLADRPDTLDLMRRNIDDLGQSFFELGYEDIAFSFGQNGDPSDASSDPQGNDPDALVLDLDGSMATPQDTPDTPRLAIVAEGVDMRL